jgi:glutamate-1-semialdehyde 2,1-aminomutase
VEPIAANMGLIPPEQGFLEGLRTECDRVGALLVFDEVITGFRVALGGAQELYGVTPDLTTMGKVIGGGLNVGAYGGRADVMDVVAPLGPVYQAGTLSGNPLATAAGLAVLDLLDADAYATLRQRADRLGQVLRDGLAKLDIPAEVTVVSSLVGIYTGDGSLDGRGPTNYAEAKTTNEQRYATLFHRLLEAGIATAPGAYEVLFPGLSHTEDVLDQLADLLG